MNIELNQLADFNPAEHLKKLAFAKMPFGKFSGKYLSEIPEFYFVWFKQKGFPDNELGKMMMEIHEIKMNGLEGLLRKIRSNELSGK